MGTIFGVWRRAGHGAVGAQEFLRRGAEQVLAGYLMYGPSTVLVYTAGQGAHAFALHKAVGLDVEGAAHSLGADGPDAREPDEVVGSEVEVDAARQSGVDAARTQVGDGVVNGDKRRRASRVGDLPTLCSTRDRRDARLPPAEVCA